MSGPVRDESKQRAWLDASELAQKIFRGHYSRAVSMVLTSELFEHAYAAGHDAVEADLAAMMASRNTAIEQRDYNREVIEQRNAMLSRSAAELADMTAERDDMHKSRDDYQAEVLRLNSQLDAVARAAERWRFEMRRDHGYAPGNYSAKCCFCGKHHVADKRAVACVECADAAIAKGAA